MKLLNYLVVFLWTVSLSTTVKCAKILFFCPIPAISHQKMYQEVWKELSLLGHQVFAVTTDPKFNKTLTNLTEYDISSMYEYKESQISSQQKEFFFHKPTFVGMIIRQIVYQLIGGNGYEYIFSHPEVKRLVSEHDRFDACVLEWFYPSVAVYGHIFNCTVIGISSTGLPVQMLDTIGNPNHPITSPEQDLPIARNEVNFFKSAWSLFWYVFVRIHYNYFIVPSEDQRIKRFYGNDTPYLGDLERNISLIILNRNMVIHRPVPNLPNVIDLGVIKYPLPVVKIDPNLKKFLDTSQQGVIYFSLGVTMSGVSMPPKYVTKIQNTFRQLKFNVVWKWENSTMLNKPDNVFISKHVPQVYVLEHPNVKLFITQGGLQSTEEAIAAHKPIIGIPFHSDQTTNVDTCVQYGMGKMLDLEELTEEKLTSYIMEIINNPSYAANAKKLDELMKDQPQDGLEKAIWWIEYVIRHKGAKHLRSIAADLPFWQYLMLDVIGFMLVVILLFIFLVYLFIRLLLKLVLRPFKGKDKDSRNSKIKKKAE